MNFLLLTLLFLCGEPEISGRLRLAAGVVVSLLLEDPAKLLCQTPDNHRP